MSTILLTWNPLKYHFNDLDDRILQVADHGSCGYRWSCYRTRATKAGDRFYLLQLGRGPHTGIIGSGEVTSNPFRGTHWHAPSAKAWYVDIEFETLLQRDSPKILGIAELQRRYPEQHWTPQSSGTALMQAYEKPVARLWRNRLGAKDTGGTREYKRFHQHLMEGARNLITATVVERNQAARLRCIEQHGISCVVCGFDFEKVYGRIGRGFIHVHHLKPLASSSKRHRVDPVEDLRPVCPNCHAMLHGGKQLRSVANLRNRIRGRKI